MEHKIEVLNSHLLTDQDIDDLMTAAFEGGINYWCGKVTFKDDLPEFKDKYASDCIALGATLILHDAESSDKWELDLEKVLKGITMFCTEANMPLSDLIDNHDADVADKIIQYALFNEQVFA